jgi:AraC-like DNA-binding protein
MPPAAAQSRFPVSLYATPNPAHQEVFYTVPRAGHVIAGIEHHIRRDHFPGHELILCLRGRGFARIGGRIHPVRAGEMLWVNCHHPHEYGADKSDPWEVLWIRMEGPRLARMCELLAIPEAPVFQNFGTESARPLYEEIFAQIASEEPEAPAMIHAAAARLIALAFAARAHQPGPRVSEAPPVLRKALERMKLFYFERLRVAELAALSGMSESHFSRVFKSAFGASPIDWLRRERISQAKRRLAETRDAIKEIASQVGYSDRYFFSKDFKRLTGVSPRVFRAQETVKERP